LREGARRVQRLLPALLVPVLLPVAPAPAEESRERTLEEIQACVAANYEHDASVSTLALRSEDRFGAVTESRATLHRKRSEDGLSKVRLRFSDPPDLRGSALLLIEKKDEPNDMFMYLPELERSRRVSGHMVSGSMFGTDFSYEQFQRMQGMARDASVERLPDRELEGRTVHVLAHRPAPEARSQFRKILSFIDPETCVPLRTEYYEHDDEEPRKVLSVDEERLERRDGRWIPLRLVMRDRRDGTQTELVFEEVRLDADVPRHVFSQSYLERGH
jgi:hypothetical protein